MTTVSVRELRERIGELLDAARAGEEVVITRRGVPVARLEPVRPAAEVRFPDRSALRGRLPPSRVSAAELVRSLRDDERG